MLYRQLLRNDHHNLWHKSQSDEQAGKLLVSNISQVLALSDYMSV